MIDPDGVDAERVLAAARTVRRGEPVVWAEGPFALGHYKEPHHTSTLLVRPDAVFACDGRVDAALPGTDAAKLADEHAGPSLLHAVLERGGPDALSELAADFVIACLDRSRRALLLSRDAFGMRPLFWARRNRSVGFASDGDVLIALGLASGELDHEVVSAYLSHADVGGVRTAFVGVSRFPGGGWMEHDVAGGTRQGRWFRPEDVAEERWALDDAADALDEALQTAVADRCREGRSILLLSGGRDSAAVAVAAARTGVALTCVTKTYDAELGCNEDELAAELAGALGLDWEAAYMPLAPTEEELAQLPVVSGTPLAIPCITEVFGMRSAIERLRPATVLNGEGGDVLFSAGPIAAFDLLRRRRPLEALRTTRAFSRSGWYRPSVVAKAAARALAPSSLVRMRDQLRPGLPWVLGPHELPGTWQPPVRSAREDVLRLVAAYSLDPNAELFDRLAVEVGARWASPLLDQRVVRIALSLPVELRVPVPGPKPVLAKAFLGPVAATRRKTSFHPYYVAVARTMREAFPSWFGSGMLASASYVSGRVLDRSVAERQEASLLCCVGVEAWLRQRLMEARER